MELNHVVDEATERAVIGGIIVNPKCYNLVLPYIPESKVFYHTNTRQLWNLLSKMSREGQHIDNITVCSSLNSEDMKMGVSKSFVVDCSSSACLETMTEVYAQKIYEKYLLRKIIAETEEIRETAITNGENVYNTITNVHTVMGELIQFRPSQKFDIDGTLMDTISDIKSKENKLIKSGYTDLDRLAGGLTRGEISIIGGRPGHGKTTFMINLLAQMVGKGYKCLLFNRELPNTEVIKKLICLESKELSYAMVRKGIYDESSAKKLERAKNIISQKYSSDKFLMFDNIKDFSKTASEVKKFRPDIVFDDYIQLVIPSGKEEQRRLQIESLCNDYKWLAKESKCAVVLASQLNRSLEMRGSKSRPQLSDLAESGAIEQVAENVFFVYYGYKQDPVKFSKNEVSIVASKVRYGDTGEFVLSYNGDSCDIYDNINKEESYAREPY